MAKKTILIDDFDQETEAAETVDFSIDLIDYEIDLSKENAKELRETFKEYTKVARVKRDRRKVKVVAAGTGKARKGDAKAMPGKREQLNAMRDWGRKNGWPGLADRGRVPADVEDAFNAAHSNGTKSKEKAKELVNA